jgi:hypothetical protein
VWACRVQDEGPGHSDSAGVAAMRDGPTTSSLMGHGNRVVRHSGITPNGTGAARGR